MPACQGASGRLATYLKPNDGPMKPTSEVAFETVIEARLLANGYVPVPGDGL